MAVSSAAFVTDRAALISTNGLIMLFLQTLFTFLMKEKSMRITLLVVSLFISGYSFAGVQDKTSQCLEGLKNDARFASIANHLAVDGQDTATPQMLADETRPDERQLSAIADLIDARSECVNFSPTQVSIGLHLAFVGLVPDLYNGKMTFGEFNRKWRVLFEETTKAPGKMLDDQSTHHHH